MQQDEACELAAEMATDGIGVADYRSIAGMVLDAQRWRSYQSDNPVWHLACSTQVTLHDRRDHVANPKGAEGLTGCGARLIAVPVEYHPWHTQPPNGAATPKRWDGGWIRPGYLQTGSRGQHRFVNPDRHRQGYRPPNAARPDGRPAEQAGRQVAAVAGPPSRCTSRSRLTETIDGGLMGMAAAASPSVAGYNRMAIVSVVCAVLAVAGTIFGGFTVLAVFAVGAGHVALNQIDRNGGQGRGLAGAGLAAGYFLGVFGILTAVQSFAGLLHISA